MLLCLPIVLAFLRQLWFLRAEVLRFWIVIKKSNSLEQQKQDTLFIQMKVITFEKLMRYPTIGEL